MRSIFASALALAVCVAGCSGRKEAPAGGAGKESSQPPAEAAAPTPGSKRVEATEFKFGRGLAPDGTVTGEGGPFSEGETLHVSFRVRNAPAGSAFKVAVTGLADKKKYYEEQKSPSEPNSTMSFTLPDTRSWPPGEYRLEMQLADAPELLHGTFDFKIAPAKK